MSALEKSLRAILPPLTGCSPLDVCEVPGRYARFEITLTEAQATHLERALENPRQTYIAWVRKRLTGREGCCPGCPGWVVSVVDRFPGVEIEVCDECKVPAEISDDDVQILPEARAALAAHPVVTGDL
jgi:hypothetical protein